MVVDKLRELIPASKQKDLEELVDEIESLVEDYDVDEDWYEESLVSNLDMFLNSKYYTLKQYVNAVKFITMCNQVETHKEAWISVFPEKHKKLIDKHGIDNPLLNRRVNSAVNNYKATELVKELTKRATVAMHIQYAGFRHEALVKNVQLMRGQASPSKIPRMKKDKETGRKEIETDNNGDPIYDYVHLVVTPQIQQQASKTVLEFTTIPIEQRLVIEEAISDESIKQQIRATDSLDALAKAMQQSIANGGNIDDIQKIGHIIDTSIEDGDE